MYNEWQYRPSKSKARTSEIIETLRFSLLRGNGIEPSEADFFLFETRKILSRFKPNFGSTSQGVLPYRGSFGCTPRPTLSGAYFVSSSSQGNYMLLNKCRSDSFDAGNSLATGPSVVLVLSTSNVYRSKI